MHRVLEALGIPTHLRNMISMFYDEHRCRIAMGGESYEGFDIGAGIRQGCPLSPLIFALVIDILLRRIQRHIPQATIRASADDIAIVVPDLFKALPILQGISTDMARVGGTELNLPKCVIIPLCLGDTDTVQQKIIEELPIWASIVVQTKGIYLGFAIGPGALESSWKKPFAEVPSNFSELG